MAYGTDFLKLLQNTLETEELKLPYSKAVAAEEFQVWKLAVRTDRTAALTCDDGNGNIVFTKEIEHTDFPLNEIHSVLRQQM